MMHKKFKWGEINQGKYPQNFLEFAFRIDPEDDDAKVPECNNLDNLHLALSSINGPTRRREVIEYYFQKHYSVHQLELLFGVSDKTIREDIRFMAKMMRTVDCVKIIESGECVAEDNTSKEEILNIRIKDTLLPTMVKKSLHCKDIFTIGDLIECSLFEISKFRNLGEHSQMQIVIMLNRFGLSLKPCSENEVEEYKQKHHCNYMTNYCVYRNECMNKVCEK